MAGGRALERGRGWIRVPGSCAGGGALAGVGHGGDTGDGGMLVRGAVRVARGAGLRGGWRVALSASVPVDGSDRCARDVFVNQWHR